MDRYDLLTLGNSVNCSNIKYYIKYIDKYYRVSSIMSSRHLSWASFMNFFEKTHQTEKCWLFESSFCRCLLGKWRLSCSCSYWAIVAVNAWIMWIHNTDLDGKCKGVYWSMRENNSDRIKGCTKSYMVSLWIKVSQRWIKYTLGKWSVSLLEFTGNFADFFFFHFHFTLVARQQQNINKKNPCYSILAAE